MALRVALDGARGPHRREGRGRTLGEEPAKKRLVLLLHHRIGELIGESHRGPLEPTLHTSRHTDLPRFCEVGAGAESSAAVLLVARVAVIVGRVVVGHV